MRRSALSALLLVVLGSGCTTADNTREAATDGDQPSPTPAFDDTLHQAEPPQGWDVNLFSDQIKLDDGRRVAVFLRQGSGAFAQVYSPDDDAWSTPHEIASSKQDLCQEVVLKATGSTVAATFGFGRFCYDGEPPQRIVAAVSTGDLSSWDVQPQDGVDDFTDVRVTERGKAVEFDGDGGTLTWRQRGGFGS